MGRKNLKIKNLDLYYNGGEIHALKNISFSINSNEVTAFIGPSGCGKSTLLRCFNKMNDLIEGVKINGSIIFDEKYELIKKPLKFNFNFFSKNNDNSISPLELRTRVGMVFQEPNPFPMTIYENVAYGPKSIGIKSKKEIRKIVEKSLKDAALYNEVKDILNNNALSLSGGQQQRLCIARAIAMSPEILLMDEPTSALDPIATSKIEQLIVNLKNKYTIIIITHSMQQATRISDNTAFFYLGKLIEYNTSRKIFTSPKEKLTSDYINGRMG